MCLSLFFYSSCLLFFFFFFSSRRRHTRLTCDWSSDVCSSDLTQLGKRGGGRGVMRRISASSSTTSSPAACPSHTGCSPRGPNIGCSFARTTRRSEERRVGKECRSRGWAYPERKKRK